VRLWLGGGWSLGVNYAAVEDGVVCWLCAAGQQGHGCAPSTPLFLAAWMALSCAPTLSALAPRTSTPPCLAFGAHIKAWTRACTHAHTHTHTRTRTHAHARTTHDAPAAGNVMLHGVETRTIPLNRLRTALLAVPQTPLIISGSILDNLDPWRKHTPREVCLLPVCQSILPPIACLSYCPVVYSV